MLEKKKLFELISDEAVIYYLKVDEIVDVLYALILQLDTEEKDGSRINTEKLPKNQLWFLYATVNTVKKKQPSSKKSLVLKHIVYTAFNV